MGIILLRAHVRRKNRRRTCRRFCSCCCDDNVNIRKSRTTSQHCKREGVKKELGRISKATKKASNVKVKLSNDRKVNRFKRESAGRTDIVDAQLKTVIVNVTRLSEDVLGVLSEFGSICAGVVDPGSLCCRSNSPSKSSGPCLNAPARRLRSTPVAPVHRNPSPCVMEKLRVLNSDWRISPYTSSKLPGNVPLPGISMKSLFLENLLICKKASNDESSKENLATQNVTIHGKSLLHLKDKKAATATEADVKSLLEPTKPCHVPCLIEPVKTSKSNMSRIPSIMKAHPVRSILPQKQNLRPSILSVKPVMVGKSPSLAEENLSVEEHSSKYPRCSSLLLQPQDQSRKTIANRRKQTLPKNSVVATSTVDSQRAGDVSESSKIPNTDDPPCDQSADVDDLCSAAKMQKTNSSRDHEIATSCPAPRTPPEENGFYTIVLSDSSDDENNYVWDKNAVHSKPAAAKVNTVKKISTERKSPTKLPQSWTDRKANASLRCTKASKNIKNSKLKVPDKNTFRTKKRVVKKNSRDPSDPDRTGYRGTGAPKHSKLVEPPTKRIRGSWKRGCRSCPGCQVDVPRKQQPKPVPMRKKIKPELVNTPSDSDSSIEEIVSPEKYRCPPKPESPLPVIIHGLISSDDSLDNIEGDQVLRDGRTAVVFETEDGDHDSEVSVEEIPSQNASDLPTKVVPEPANVDVLRKIKNNAGPHNVCSQETSMVNTNEADLPKAYPSVEDSSKIGSAHLKRSFQNFQVQRQVHDIIESVPRSAKYFHSIASSRNSTSLETLHSADSLLPCRKVDNSICEVPDEASKVKDGSWSQQSREINDSQGITSSTPGICFVTLEDVQLSNDSNEPESQCNEENGALSLAAESLDSSIAIENFDSQDSNRFDCSSNCEPHSEEDLDKITEKGQDHGQKSSPPTSGPGPEWHHSGSDVSVLSDDLGKPIKYMVSNCSAFENTGAKLNRVTDKCETSLVCNSPCEQGSVLEKRVQDSPGTGCERDHEIPAPDEIQMLKSDVMPDVNGGLDALQYQTLVDNNDFPGHENKCERPTISNDDVSFLNDVDHLSTTLLEPQIGGTGTKEPDQACEKSHALCQDSSLQDEVAHLSLLENTLYTSIGSQEAPFKSRDQGIRQDNVPQMTAADQDHGSWSSDLDGVLCDTDQSKKESLNTNLVVDELATTGESRGPDNHPPRENQPKSQKAISSKLSHLLHDCLNDPAVSVKLDNREVVISKVNIESKGTVHNPSATAELYSPESASVVKELNLEVPLNPRLMIRKLPLLHEENSAPSVVCSGDSKSCVSEDNVTRNDHPEGSPSSTPVVTTLTKSFYERKGYPTPIKKLNPSVLSVIKYNDLEINSDEPSLNDPRQTDLVECVTSEGVRFSLNPEDLSAIEDFLNTRPTEVDRPVAPSPKFTKEAEADQTVDDLVIYNDEPPLNPSPVKNWVRPLLTPDDEEDLEDLLIDNDAPPLNESPEGTQVKPVSNDSDCLVISSDDEIHPASVANPQDGKNLEIKTPPVVLSKQVPRPRKKLFRKRRSVAADIVQSSSDHKQRNTPSKLELPRVNVEECTRVANQDVFKFNEAEISGNHARNDIVVNDCGMQTKRQPSKKALPPFQSSKNQLNSVDDPIRMNNNHDIDLCSPEQDGISKTQSSNQVFDLSDLECLGGDVVEEIVIDDSFTDSRSQSSWQPLPRYQGSQETLLQPQVFNLQGQPLKLNQDHSDSTISTTQVTCDLSETTGDTSRIECLSISDCDTIVGSDEEGDVVMMSPPNPRSTAQTVESVHENGGSTEDSSHIAVSDSDDDDIIVLSGPESFPRVNRTLNSKQSTVNPLVQHLHPQASGFGTPRNGILPTFSGSQISPFPSVNGDFHYVLVVPQKRLFPS